MRHVAWQTIARHACHPRRAHFKLDLGGEQGWQHEAYEALMSTGIMQDCGNRYEKDKSTTHDMHELGVQRVPELLVFHRGDIVERSEGSMGLDEASDFVRHVVGTMIDG